MSTLANTLPKIQMDDIYSQLGAPNTSAAPREAFGAPYGTPETSKLGYSVSDDLAVTLTIFGHYFTVDESRKDELLEMLDDLTSEYEQKALALDIQEGNCG